MDQKKLESIIESILFVSGEPVKISKICKITQAKKGEVENAIMILKSKYSSGSGLAILSKENEIQMATNPDNGSFISALVKSEIQENLSRAALEVLSIVAYRNPITRANIEAIRGVNCSFTLRSLLMRGLLERRENLKDNRGYLYSISFDFLKKLGIDSVEKLPDYESLSKDKRVGNLVSGGN